MGWNFQAYSFTFYHQPISDVTAGFLLLFAIKKPICPWLSVALCEQTCKKVWREVQQQISAQRESVWIFPSNYFHYWTPGSPPGIGTLSWWKVLPPRNLRDCAVQITGADHSYEKWSFLLTRILMQRLRKNGHRRETPAWDGRLRASPWWWWRRFDGQRGANQALDEGGSIAGL